VAEVWMKNVYLDSWEMRGRWGWGVHPYRDDIQLEKGGSGK